MATDKCRICLGRKFLVNIFVKHGTLKVSTQIMSICKVKISQEDGLPNTICEKCLKKLQGCINFIKQCEKTDSELRAALFKDEDENSHNKILNFTNDYNSMSIDDEYKYIECKLSPKSDLLIDETLSTSIINDNLTDDAKDQSIDKKSQKQQCFTCGKVMSSRFRLKTHLRTHTGERPYSCPHCKKTFSLAQSLKVHMRIHTGEKPLQCPVCGESFAQSAGLAAHRRKHTGQLPYHCVLCPRSFRTVGHLQYHVRRHTGEKNFECDTCGRAFITRSDLKQHILTHTGDRPHVCCICGLRLSRASHLKRHIQHTHNVQKQFACNLCSAKFTHKVEYEKHKKTHSETSNNDSDRS